MDEGLRYPIRAAITWLLASEIVRRYSASLNLHLVETHPGGGQYDCLTLLRLRDGATDVYDFADHRGDCHFNVRSGNWMGAFGSPGEKAQAAKAFDFQSAWLRAADPAVVVDRVSEALGLPAFGGVCGPTTRKVLGVRLIARLLSRYALERQGLRAIMGICDSSGVSRGGPRPELQRFPWALTAPWREPQSSPRSLESRSAGCWLIQPMASDGGPDQGGAVALIRMDGMAAAAAAPDETVDLYDLFQRSGRQLWPCEQALLSVIERR